MEEPVRLACPECDAVYRVKNFTLGKAYNCKKCGTPLVTMREASLACPSCGDRTAPARIDVSKQATCPRCPDRPAMVLAEADGDSRAADIASINQVAAASASANVAPPPSRRREGESIHAGVREKEAKEAVDAQLKRLGALADTLASRLDLLREAENHTLREGLSEVDSKLASLSQNLEQTLSVQAANLVSHSRALEDSISALSTHLDMDTVKSLSVEVREMGERLLARLDEFKAGQREELGELLKAAFAEALEQPGVKPDPDALTRRVLDGFEQRMNNGGGGFVNRAAMETEASRRLEEQARLEQLAGEMQRLSDEVAAFGRHEIFSTMPERIARDTSGKVESAVAGQLRQALAEQGEEVKRLSGLITDVSGRSEALERIPARVSEELAGKVEGLLAGPIEKALGRHAEEVKRASAQIEEAAGRKPDVDELGHELADHVARNVEDRVVGPVVKALSRQAPEILAAIQDEKLSDTIMKSVREAQRPLMREVVSGRKGVPLWLFASLLLPLLLILGYLFLPGELGLFGPVEGQSGGAAAEAVERELTKLSSGGVPLNAAADARLRSIEGAVNDMYENAWAQVKNSGDLEAEVRNLRRTLAERDQLIGEYNSSLQKQSRRIRAYEIQLTRLGISPDAVPDGEDN